MRVLSWNINGLRSCLERGDFEQIRKLQPLDAIIIDDCGKIKGYLPNRVLRADNGKPCDILFGTFLITGLTEEDIGSLSNYLAKKYFEKFRWPECFLKSDAGNLIVMKPGSKENPTILESYT